MNARESHEFAERLMREVLDLSTPRPSSASTTETYAGTIALKNWSTTIWSTACAQTRGGLPTPSTTSRTASPPRIN